MATLSIIQALESAALRKDIPEFRVGDTVAVHYKIVEGDKLRVQVFRGVVIKRHRAGLRAILEIVEANPSMAQAILVETMGAGPRVAELRDRALNDVAQVMYEETVHGASVVGGPAFASADEAFAIVGATFELVSRQLRTGEPERLLDLEPLVQRLILGLLSQPRE